MPKLPIGQPSGKHSKIRLATTFRSTFATTFAASTWHGNRILADLKAIESILPIPLQHNYISTASQFWSSKNISRAVLGGNCFNQNLNLMCPKPQAKAEYSTPASTTERVAIHQHMTELATNSGKLGDQYEHCARPGFQFFHSSDPQPNWIQLQPVTFGLGISFLGAFGT